MLGVSKVLIILLIFSSSIFAGTCKIGSYHESSFIKPNKNIIEFINKETRGLFFKKSVTYTDFKNKFGLRKTMPGDKYNSRGRDDTTYGWKYAFSQGKWHGALEYTKNGGSFSPDFNGFASNGPIYLSNGLAKIESRWNDFPNSIQIFQHLEKNYYSNDIFNAIRKKYKLKNLKACVYGGVGNIGGGYSCDSGQLLYKYKGRYFKLNTIVLGIKNNPDTTGNLQHTVIRYDIKEFGSEVKEYYKCINLKAEGSKLKL